MDSQNANVNANAEVVKPEAAPAPVICRVCMHVNPAGTPVCQMCCNDLLSDTELDKLFAEQALCEEAVEETPAAAPVPVLETAEEAPYVEPVFEDDEMVVASKKVEKMLRKLDAEVAKYKIKADAYTEAIEREKKPSRRRKNEKRLAKLTMEINKVIAKYRKKLLREKYDLPLYPWEAPVNA